MTSDGAHYAPLAIGRRALLEIGVTLNERTRKGPRRWRAWVAADLDDVPDTSGFERRPPRPRWQTVVLFVVVVAVATAVAHLFRETAAMVIEWYADRPDVVGASSSVERVLVFALVSVSVLSAAWIGVRVESRWPSATGIEAVAASARGHRRRISLRASGARAVGTWLASAGLTSIGRESAIIEIGGAFGSVTGRRSRGRGDALAAAGIAAAFAAAYHAPVAAVLYLEEHLRVVRSRRALLFSVAGALAGHLVSVHLWGAHPVFPAPDGSRWAMLGWSLVVLVPTAIAARTFRWCRVRVRADVVARRLRVPRWSAVAGFALVAGAAVAVQPFAAGNGMEAMRQAAAGPTVSIALALVVGKLIGTTASLGSGAPGGALTPTVSIAAGTAVLTLLGVERLGLDAGSAVAWGVMASSMAVGLTVGLRAPLLAIALVPEFVGEYSLLPLVAVLVAVAVVVDRCVDRAVARVSTPVPDVIYDEDG